MSGYLTLEEAAERLGVDYKTVYRLVRGGELPAGKVGRVYRIRQEDLDAYFQRQKEAIALEARRGLTALADVRCGACGRRVLSELSIGGRCELTDKPICQACWSIKKIRRCEPDGEAPADEAPEAVSTGAPSGGPTAAGGEGPGESTEQVIQRLRAEGRAVLAHQDARLAEETFLRAFAQRLERIDELPEPLSGLTINLRQARAKHQMEPTVRAGKHLPRNCISRFTLRVGGWGKPKGCLILEGRFLSRPDVLARDGFDAEPIGAAELSALLNDVAEEARRQEGFRLVLVGSPTGWTEAAAATVTDPHGSKAFHDRRAAVALCDLHSDRVFMDDSDERLRAYWPLLAPGRFAEEIERCAEALRDALVEKNSISFDRAVATFGAEAGCVRAAVAKLSRAGEVRTDELPDIGLVISRP